MARSSIRTNICELFRIHNQVTVFFNYLVEQLKNWDESAPGRIELEAPLFISSRHLVFQICIVCAVYSLTLAMTDV